MKEKFEAPESKFPELTQELARRAAEDQELRQRVMQDTSNLELAAELDRLDRDNAAWLKITVQQIGWPTISKVGEQGSSDAWLIAQHADHDIGFQREVLNMMKGASSGDVDLHDIAYLEDRILVKEDEPQIYGTQFHSPNNDGVYEPHPIANPDHVDERRAGMGLNTLAENTQVINESNS